MFWRRCISPPLKTSMPAASCSRIAACEARDWASRMSSMLSAPASTCFSKTSYHLGTL